MQFVGSAFIRSEEFSFEQWRDQAALHDLLISKTLGEGNFREGLRHFAEFMDVSVVQFSAFNEHDKKASSRQISDELMAYHRDNTNSVFLNFFSDDTVSFPPRFYLIFACDWQENGPVRFEKISRKALKAYFRQHNSWYLWLYNYSAAGYYPKLDLPLILEVTND